MAFEQLNKFTDSQKESVLLCIKMQDRYRSEGNHDMARNMFWQESAHVYALFTYYATALSHPKFRSQREYCKKVLQELAPAQSLGYFGK